MSNNISLAEPAQDYEHLNSNDLLGRFQYLCSP
jgi:hypothetical protein